MEKALDKSQIYLNYRSLFIRFDALIEEQGVLRNFLFTNNLDQKTVRNAGCVKEDFISIAFGPKEPNAQVYAKLLGDTVVEMRKDGRLKKLLDSYGLPDWQKQLRRCIFQAAWLNFERFELMGRLR